MALKAPRFKVPQVDQRTANALEAASTNFIPMKRGYPETAAIRAVQQALIDFDHLEAVKAGDPRVGQTGVFNPTGGLLAFMMPKLSAALRTSRLNSAFKSMGKSANRPWENWMTSSHGRRRAGIVYREAFFLPGGDPERRRVWVPHSHGSPVRRSSHDYRPHGPQQRSPCEVEY